MDYEATKGKSPHNKQNVRRRIPKSLDNDNTVTNEIEIESENEIEIESEPDLTIVEHSEYANLKMLGDIYLLAKGGGAITTTLDSSVIAQFKSLMDDNVLHLAALYGNDEIVDRVAKQDKELLFSFNKNHETPLHVATKAGHVHTLRKLLGYACVDSNSVTRVIDLMKEKSCYNNKGNSLLHDAMNNSNMGSVIFHVLEECKIVDKSGRSLSQCCYEFALSVVNKERQSVLCLAVMAGLKETTHRILDKCPESATPKGISPLHASIIKRDKDMMALIMHKKQEWIHLRDVNGRLALHWAASIGYLEGVVYLLDICQNCSIERDNKYGYLPLHLAAREGHVEVVKELLGYCHLDPDQMLDKFGHSILHIAAISGMLDLVQYILQSPRLDKLINQKTVFGNTPLHLAAIFGHARIVYALTWDRRVDFNMINHKNQTPRDIKPAAGPLRQYLIKVALESGGAKRNLSKEAKSAKQLSARQERFRDMLDSLSVISTLIATASVAACLAVPGEANGAANNLHMAIFQLFIFCITVSLFSSLAAATIILICRRLGKIELLELAARIASMFLGVAVIALSLSFLAGIYTVTSKLPWLATTFMIITAIFTAGLFALYALFYLPSPSTRMASRYISYYPFIFYAWLADTPTPYAPFFDALVESLTGSNLITR